MSEATVKKTNCHFCGYLCGFNATVEDGRIVDLVPDPSRYPYDEQILRGCRRWKMNIDVLDDPNRINYPLRRVGKRGSGEFERISWDEALDEIAGRLRALIEEHGPQTLASAIGGPHASFWPLHRFMNLLGSPNNMGIGQICWNPRIWMDAITFGWTIEADIVPGLTEALFIWGTNPAQSDNSAFWRFILQVAKSDMPLVVVDPRRTQVAAKADLWLPIRPGTDCVLALGMMHVIVAEGLHDAAFIDRWCHGFDELAEHLKGYDPATVAEICGLPEEDIVRAARMFGGAQAAALVSGRGIDQVGSRVAPTHRAITCLRAITGNVDKPGACVLTEKSDFSPEVELEMSDSLAPEQRAFCLNTAFTPLQCYDGYERVRRETEKLGRTLPMRYLTSAHPDLVLKAMETGDPYPIRALVVEATNPLLTYADTHRVFDAFMSLDLIVVLEYYMTSTASIADYVLPAAGAMERPLFQAHGGVANIAYGGPAAVDPYYERRTDYDFFREMGIRFGQAEQWPDATLAQAYETTLAACSTTWEEFCASGLYHRSPAFNKHEAIGEDGSPVGFATPSGKIELASELLTELGGQRLPTYEPPAHAGHGAHDIALDGAASGDWAEAGSLGSAQAEVPQPVFEQAVAGQIPESARDVGFAVAPTAATLGFAATLITGARKQPYNASMFLHNSDFRTSYPEPLLEMSPETAAQIGLADGDTAAVVTAKGRAVFRVKTAPMRDGVVSADYGWWYPEMAPGAPEFGGIWTSNINLATSCAVSGGEAMIGTWSYNAIDCVVEKLEHSMLSSAPGK